MESDLVPRDPFQVIDFDGIGLNYVSCSPFSTDRRKQLVSRVKEFAEETRVAIRNVRRDANKNANTSQKDKVLTEVLCESTKEEI